VRPATSVIVTPVAADVAGAMVGAAVGSTSVGAAVGCASVGGAIVAGAAGTAVGALVGAWVAGEALVPQALSSSANTSASVDALRRINIIAPCYSTKNRPSMLKIG